MSKKYKNTETVHSEDLQEIITKPPSWLLKWGISVILATIIIILNLSVFITYPEMVSVSMKFNTSNAPKVLVSKVNGNLSKILIKDGVWVEKNIDIAYMESIADHHQVLMILDRLKKLRNNEEQLIDIENLVNPTELNLGELQNSYQSFHLAYLNYKAVNKAGIFEKRKNFVQNEVQNIDEQKSRIEQTYELQQKELRLAESEYEKYKILAYKKVISQSELEQKESLLLSKRQTIPLIENTLLSNQINRMSKGKEISELSNQIFEERKKFFQAVNTFITDAENWKRQYVISSLSSGILIYGDFLQENQLVKVNDVLFYINANKDDYYGEVLIPQGASSRVKKNQDVLIKVKSYPYQEYGYLKGKVTYISDIPIRDSIFFSKVDIIRSVQDSSIKLKPGLRADAEIITDNQSIFKRIWLNLTKNLKI
ncbi:HlyD family secretion protein [Sphingobacterium anhuiense]|uniref:HlyD family secretion protein n=1 Tax=Sphingobacterium anhuiense TaxID=493780 RepID=A0ABW5YXY2_9SPHI